MLSAHFIDISPVVSLEIVAALLAITVGISLLAPRDHDRAATEKKS
jgi:hypothetical protein